MAYMQLREVCYTDHETGETVRVVESHRLREFGVKGMKWGTRRDRSASSHLAKASALAREKGQTKMADAMDKIHKDAQTKGYFHGGHVNRLAALASRARDMSIGDREEEGVPHVKGFSGASNHLDRATDHAGNAAEERSGYSGVYI